MEALGNGILLLARLLLSVLFLVDGWIMLTGAAATQAYFTRLGLPLPQLAWIIAVTIELAGGLAILFGLLVRPAAVILAIFCIATALIAHVNFADTDAQIHFIKNLAMAGGFLYVAVSGAGGWSLDTALARRRRTPRTG
jgi:putative oxidoreductase